MKKSYKLFIAFVLSCLLITPQLMMVSKATEDTSLTQLLELLKQLNVDTDNSSSSPLLPNLPIDTPIETPICDGKLYSVDQLSGTSFISLGCYNTFNEAKTMMELYAPSYGNVVVRYGGSYSPMKIAHASSAYAIASIGTTLNVYQKPDLSSDNENNWNTYTANGTKFYFLDAQFNTKSQLVYKVSVGGFEGYVDARNVDLVPTSYLVDDRPFTIRDRFNNPKMINQSDANFYQVVSSGQGYNELYYYTGTIGNPTIKIGPYAKAPSYLPVGYYYSRDGITFYRDPYFKEVVNPNMPFYNYFQYLPLRSRSNVSAQTMQQKIALEGYSADSVYYQNTQEFINNQERYGINSLLVFSLASLESRYGTSHYARTKQNLFGWNAIDANPDLASSFNSVSHSIQEHMAINLFEYSSIFDWRFTGPAFGDKGAGFASKYASDPDWALKIAAIAYQTDKLAGFIDLNAYQLGILSDGYNINVRSAPNAYASLLYTTNGYTKNLKRQSIAITGHSNDYYQFVAWFPINYGFAITNHNKGNYNFDFNNNHGYINDEYVTIANRFDYVANRLPKDPLVTDFSNNLPANVTPTPANQARYVVEPAIGLRVRSLPSTFGDILGVLAKGQQVFGTMENGWLKISYNGQTSYVSGEFVRLIPTAQNNVPSTTQPNIANLPNLNLPTTPANGNVSMGDVNGDSQITTLDLVMLQRHILGIRELDKQQVTKADTNNDGKITTLDVVNVQRHILGIKPLR